MTSLALWRWLPGLEYLNGSMQPFRNNEGRHRGSVTQVPEDKGRACENEAPPTVGKEVQEHLRNLKVYKSMEPDEMYLWVLRELADKIVYWVWLEC